MTHSISLSEFASRYANETTISVDYAARLLSRAVALETFCGERAIDVILTEQNINRLLSSLAGKSPRTIRSYRGDLITIWNRAADLDLIRYPIARRIRCERLPDLLVQCYMLEEARALLSFAGTIRGVYPNSIPRMLYWRAAILVGWDSGMRRGDCWMFRRDWVRPDNTVRIVQRKTKQLAEFQLRSVTIEALDAIGNPQPLAWLLGKEQFGRHFKRIVRGSGVNRGTFRWLRRASGSYVEAQQPGAGYKHLGHKTPAIFDRHYDARLGGHMLPMPPEL